MSILKRPKTSRARGTHTHGWGHKKKHRGSGKRGDAKKPTLWKTGRVLGKFGFKTHNAEVNTITIRILEHMDLKEEKGAFVFDGKAHKVHKILGTGNAKRAYSISNVTLTAKAQSKIEAAGGTVAAVKEEKAAVEEETA